MHVDSAGIRLTNHHAFHHGGLRSIVCGTNYSLQLSLPWMESSIGQFLYDSWAVQARWLIPLTFIPHCLSHLAAFTSGAYFLQNGRQWQ